MSTERAGSLAREPARQDAVDTPALATVAATQAASQDRPPLWAGIALAAWAAFVYLSYALAYAH